jgi:predicted Zn-dependent protease with MMP-like domain
VRGVVSPRRISPEEFESYVEEALASIPDRFRAYLENAVVVVEEEPSDEDYEQTDTPEDQELFGIFRGVPFFDRGSSVSSLPAQVVIFRGPILRNCSTRGEGVREIRDTVVHEIGHVLGLDDEEMPY